MLPRILKSSRIWRRGFCDKAPGISKDPVYQTFLDKVREYRLKSPTGKPVDPTPEYEEELKESIEKLALRYGGGEGVDLLAFPKFKLPDLDIDPISIYDLPEYKDKEIKDDEKVEEPEKEAKSKKEDKEMKEAKEKKDKGKKEDKAKKAKDDKKAKPKDKKK
ncbi:hypothetical protein KR059_008387 [Drosophila kikkawai]|nr:hypothetical protein KR059_008387 [Drosophila kikkawai]